MLFIYFLLASCVFAVDEQCSEYNCQLPSCQCARIGENPTSLDVDEIPQLISLVFVGTVNVDAVDSIRSIFNPIHRNPNKCPITGTFFVDPFQISTCLVQRLFDNQHEIAMGFSGTKCLTQNCDERDRQDDLKESYKTLIHRTQIHQSHVKGFRLINGQIDGQQHFTFIKETHFHYDSSMLFKSSALVWPFTLNYPFDQVHCSNCPLWKQNFDAIWQFPLHQWSSPNSTRSCQTLADTSCLNIDQSESLDYFYELFMYNFERHSSLSIGQRCPWIIELDFSWLSQPKNVRLQALVRFIQTITQNRAYRHVYFVSIEKTLEWMKSPRSISELAHFWSFRCSDPLRVYSTNCSNNDLMDRFENQKVNDSSSNETNRKRSVLLDLTGEKLFPSSIAFHVLWIFILLILTVLFYDKYLANH